MFEAAEVGSSLSKAQYKAQVPRLRTELLDVQRDLRAAPFSVIVLFAGVDTAGKSETVNLLNDWMDPRWVMTRGYVAPSDEERERPRLWRYWRDLPPHGTIAVFLSAWYSSPIRGHVAGRVTTAELDAEMEQVAAFERALTDDGTVVVKFWMHLGKAAQKRRLKAMEKNAATRWRVTKEQWRHWRKYDAFVATAEHVIQRTSTDQAPWHIVEGEDERYRSVFVATELRDAIRRGLARKPSPIRKRSAKPGPIRAALRGVTREHNVLASLDMTRRLGKQAFKADFSREQGRLGELQRRARGKGISTVVVFEGWDAAGKGGAIRRVTAALDARDREVIQVAAPTDEERARHYLWRFWRRLSRAGRITLFDRSWYGRVLVERVERLATEAEYMRAYGEITHFEEQLVAHDILLIKFWIHITKDEQLERFRARQRTPHKRWKITDEDWRNRQRWDDYTAAVNEMVARTSTPAAPWTLVEGNDKRYARAKILTTIADGLEDRLD